MCRKAGALACVVPVASNSRSLSRALNDTCMSKRRSRSDAVSNACGPNMAAVAFASRIDADSRVTGAVTIASRPGTAPDCTRASRVEAAAAATAASRSFRAAPHFFRNASRSICGVMLGHSRRRPSTCALPLDTARVSGVRPRPSRASVLAPKRRRTAAISSWSAQAAMCNAVEPFPDGKLTSAPAVRSARMISRVAASRAFLASASTVRVLRQASQAM